MRAGTRKVRSFATGQGRGWPWSKTPAYRRLRPGGAYGKRRHEAQSEALNITSNCITRSRHDAGKSFQPSLQDDGGKNTSADARSYTIMRYVMSRISSTDGLSKHRRSPGVHLPLGDRGGQSGGHSRARCGSGRNQAFFVLMAGAATRSRAQRRSSGQQCKEGLTAFPFWVGRERQRPGGDTPSPGGDLLAAGRYRFLGGWSRKRCCRGRQLRFGDRVGI